MKYERITPKDLVELINSNDKENIIFLHYAMRLQELEDKIENGTLIELPCKVGDTVYIATPLWDIKKVVEAKVACVEYSADDNRKDYRFYLDHEYVFSKTNPNLIVNRYIFRTDEFFATKAEAEAKLKELQGE